MKKALLNTKGYILFEAVLATAIFALFTVAFLNATGDGLNSLFSSQERERAVFIAEEGLEAARAIRDVSFDDLTDGSFGLAFGSTWQLDTAPESVDGFSRQLDISSLDGDRKEVEATVSWQRRLAIQSVSFSTLLTRWPEAVASGSWTTPKYLGTLNMSGTQDGLKVQAVGSYAYVIRSGSTTDFLVIDISNPAAPAIVGSTNIASTARDLAITGNYAAVTSNDNSAEISIVNITNPLAPTVVGTYNASGNSDGLGVVASGNVVYFTRAGSSSNSFYILNISNPVVPVLTGSLFLGSSGNYNDLFVLGNYVYAVSSVNSPEFNVINITNPAVPTLTTTRDLSGNDDAYVVTGYGNALAVGRANGQISIINVTTPASPFVVAPISVSYNVNDLAVSSADNYLFIANDNDTSELQIWSLATPSSPTLVGSFNATGDLNGIAYDSINDQIIAVSDENAEEFAIFAPGP